MNQNLAIKNPLNCLLRLQKNLKNANTICVILLVIGLIAAQIPSQSHSLAGFAHWPLSICLAFLMFNFGRHSTFGQSGRRAFLVDCLVAFGAAAFGWLLVAGYFIFFMHSHPDWVSGDCWKQMFLVSRFAAPTSAGILISLLTARRVAKKFTNKLGNLAILDDVDSLLLVVVLQALMIGLKWQLFAVGAVSILLLVLAWKFPRRIPVPCSWASILFYASILVGMCGLLHFFGIHMEVLLPAFIFGKLIKPSPAMLDFCEKTGIRASNRVLATVLARIVKPTLTINPTTEERVSGRISAFFMLLVGLSMPPIILGRSGLSLGELILHVSVITVLMIAGKCAPVFFYWDRSWRERFALWAGMCARGEVGAAVLAISLSYGIESRFITVAALALTVNLCLSPVFIAVVKALVGRDKEKECQSDSTQSASSSNATAIEPAPEILKIDLQLEHELLKHEYVKTPFLDMAHCDSKLGDGASLMDCRHRIHFHDFASDIGRSENGKCKIGNKPRLLTEANRDNPRRFKN